jgi:hypothetical protein
MHHFLQLFLEPQLHGFHLTFSRSFTISTFLLHLEVRLSQNLPFITPRHSTATCLEDKLRDFTQIHDLQPKLDVQTHCHHRAILITRNMRDFTQRLALQPGFFDKGRKLGWRPLKNRSKQGLQGFASSYPQRSLITGGRVGFGKEGWL